jgi:flagellar protein FliL
MAKDEEKKEGEETKKRGKMKLIIMLLPMLLLVGAAVWFFFLRSTDDGAPAALPEPVPGAVVALEPITINLAGSHFLKLGMALQPTADAHEAPDGSKALDLAIAQFSGDTIESLSTEEGRREAKKELVARIQLAYLPHDGTTFEEATGQKTGESSGKATHESSSESTKTSGTEESSTSQHSSEEGHPDIGTMSGAEVIKLTQHLTVQPEVYDVYFTEFVMQ